MQLLHFLSFTARVIDVSSGKVHVAERCLEETGGLGVDIVIDAGGEYLRAEQMQGWGPESRTACVMVLVR